MVTRDARSVRELLVEADSTTRRILVHACGRDAEAMLRTWGDVAQSAAELWDAIPVQPGDPQPRTAMRPLQAMTRSLHTWTLARGWPEPGPPHELLLQVAENLTRAGDLIRAHTPASQGGLGPARALTPEVASDAAAVRMRIMHVLYVGSHGVNVALRDLGRDLQSRATRFSSTRQTRPAHLVGAALQRMDAFEAYAGEYVNPRFGQVLRGEHVDQPAPDSDRLWQALGVWNEAAHHSLSGEPAVEVVAVVARVQVTVTAAAAAILQAASLHGVVDADLYEHRLSRTLDRLADSWAALATEASALTGSHATVTKTPATLQSAAVEVRAALVELTHGQYGLADHATLAARTDLAHATATVRKSLIVGSELARVVHDVLARTPMPVSARAAAQQIGAAVDHAFTAHTAPPQEANAVTPRDVARNQTIPAPHLVRQRLLEPAGHTAQAAAVTLSAVSALQTPAGSPEPPAGTRSAPRPHPVSARPAPGVTPHR